VRHTREEIVVENFSLSLALVTALLTGAARLASADPINLIFATTEPAGSVNTTEVFQPWADAIAKAAKDALHIDVREGFAIANATNNLGMGESYQSGDRRMDGVTSGRGRVARHLSQADRRCHRRQIAIEAESVTPSPE
jgi:hypothetical protein